MTNYFFGFPRTTVKGSEVVELKTEVTRPFTVNYLIAYTTNSNDLWVEDLLVGEWSFFSFYNFPVAVPIDCFYPGAIRLMFDSDIEAKPGEFIRVKLRNTSTEPREVQIGVFGTIRITDC